MKAYLAYGANTNLAEMRIRCPEAQYICNVTLHHFRLVFRGVADVVPHRGSRVVCALWVISPKDEAALDRFEGFPNYYVKRYVTMHLNGKRHRVMFYVVRAPRGECIPARSYERCLREGYAQCGMPDAQITNAIARAERSTRQIVDRSSWARKDAAAIAKQNSVDDEVESEAAALDLMDWYRNHNHNEVAK